jgi:hypothetical protein
MNNNLEILMLIERGCAALGKLVKPFKAVHSSELGS